MSVKYFVLVTILLVKCLLGEGAFAHSLILDLNNKASITKINGEVVLEEKDWQWFRDKDVLVVGIVRVYDPPFGVVVGNKSYEGMTAEYLALIATLLNVRIEIRHYDSMLLLHEALSRGEIDMFEAGDNAEAVGGGACDITDILVGSACFREAFENRKRDCY